MNCIYDNVLFDSGSLFNVLLKIPCTGLSFVFRPYNQHICDAIWENPPHVAQGNFVKINKITLKLLSFSLFFMNFDNM